MFEFGDELEALYHLHLWRVKKIFQNNVELLYADSYLVTMAFNESESSRERLLVKYIGENLESYTSSYHIFRDLTLQKSKKSGNNSTTVIQVRVVSFLRNSACLISCRLSNDWMTSWHLGTSYNGKLHY